jgi:hypothetical protein
VQYKNASPVLKLELVPFLLGGCVH